MTISQQPPRGWYPDPAGSRSWRWWDGVSWSDELHPFVPSQSTITPLAMDREQSAGARMASIGLLFFGVSAILGIFLRVTDVAYLSAMWHWFHQIYSQAQKGQTISSLPASPVRSSWSSVIDSFVILPLEVVALVVTLTFQHRAAKVAKQLGLAARLNPTFGVISWFIPLANLVLPLVAWLDLFPSRHPRRSALWAAWAFLLVSVLLTVAVYAVASTSTLAVGLLSGLQVLGFAGAIVFARSAVLGVIEEHHLGASSAGVAAH